MEHLPELHIGKLHLLVAPGEVRRGMAAALTARLALNGPLRVLDGGNSFAAHQIARHVRRSTVHLHETLRRIQLARAFTCYQVLALLESAAPAPIPTLMLDLLSTFYDENVQLQERRSLLQTSLQYLRRLSQQTTVLVSASLTSSLPDSPSGETELLHILESAADQVWRFELPSPPAQPRLF